MKKLFIVYFLCLHGFAIAQVGIGTNSPDLSAQLEVRSTTKGFLPPRMTETERNSISNPTAGLVVFNTTTNGLEIYTSGAWKKLAIAGTNSDITQLNGLSNQKLVSIIPGPINTSSYSPGDIVYDQSDGKFYLIKPTITQASPSYDAPTSYYPIFDAGRAVIRIRPTESRPIVSITLHLGNSITNAVLSMYSGLAACVPASCYSNSTIATVNTASIMGSSTSTTASAGKVTFVFTSPITVVANTDYYLSFSSTCVMGPNIGVFGNQRNNNFEISYGGCGIDQGVPSVRINYDGTSVL